MLAQVVKAGRRRRLVLAGGGGSVAAVAVVLAVVAVASLGTSRSDTLRQLDPASGTQPTPGASAVVQQHVTAAGPATAPPHPSARPAVVTGTTPEGATRPQPGAAVPPAARPDGRKPATRSANRYGAVCTGDNSGIGGNTSGVSTAPWCVTASVLGSSTSRVFDLQVCRDPAATGADLSFATSQEVDYTVTDESGHAVWVWSGGQVFAQKTHPLHFNGGDCYQWQTPWDGRADDGRRVAPHQTLKLTASCVAAEIRRRQAAQSFTS
jgi:hypothetical protein